MTAAFAFDGADINAQALSVPLIVEIAEDGRPPFQPVSDFLATHFITIGAGSAVAYVPDELQAAEGADAMLLLQMISLHLAPTRSQLADALGVSRQRIYQLLDGESPSPETLARLHAVATLTREWQARHSRPMGMILPKPTKELNALWQALAQQPTAQSTIDGLMDGLAARHAEFEARENRLTPFRLAQQEPGQRGLLPPVGYWSE